jgi:hypothetical protein
MGVVLVKNPRTISGKVAPRELFFLLEKYHGKNIPRVTGKTKYMIRKSSRGNNIFERRLQLDQSYYGQRYSF